MTRERSTRPVGRPREFDEEQVLTAAMDAFWRKGYEATSLSDLCDCTGLHKGSLYQTFGDKHQLFMRSLQHYADCMVGHVSAAARTSESPLENIRGALRAAVSRAGSEQGCMMINSLVELAPHDPEVRAALQMVAGKELGMMTELVARAQQAGEISDERDPARIARQLMVTLAGLAATVKGFVNADEALETIDDAVNSLV
jgi:TetR/AcrR family transcriptional repressor of nem operon